MPIKILHVVEALETGGMEAGVVKLIRNMDSERFEQAVCATRRVSSLANEIQDRAQIICLDQPAGRRFQVASLARAIRRIKPDIVHSHNWSAIEAVLAGRWVGSCRLVHSEHGIETDGAFREPWRRRWFRRIAYEMADHVFCVSAQLRDHRAQETGFPVKRIDVVRNGVDTRRFSFRPELRSTMRERMGVSPDEFCIGAVGRLEAVKGLDTLLHSVASAGASNANWRVLLIGDGAERSRLEHFVRESPYLAARIRFLGDVGNVAELLAALDVYVLPSISEGISNSLLEAMATGLPVIASSVGGNVEVVCDGESGLLFPTRDSQALAQSLERIHRNPEFAKQLGRNAVDRVKKEFSLDTMVSNYERMYARLVEAKRAITERAAA